MSFSDELSSFPADPDSGKVIERWLEHAGADEMWKNLLRAESRRLRRQAIIPATNVRLDPKEFIQVVLSARYGVDPLIGHEAWIRERFEGLKTDFANCVQIAESPSEIEDAIKKFKPKFEALDRSIYHFGASTPVSRKDKDGSRTRKAFALRVQGYFQIRCGAPMNNLMPRLLDIVFGYKGGDDVHTEDEGRIGRRATTKAGRGRR
jgi:hypothetical protein